MKERFISLSMEERLWEPVSGRAVLNGLSNFMHLFTTHLAPRGHVIKKVYYMYDPGWELDDGKLCAELFFQTVCRQAEITFTVPCYFQEGSNCIDIHYEVSVNGKHNVELGSEVMCITLDKEAYDAQQWADELAKKILRKEVDTKMLKIEEVVNFILNNWYAPDEEEPSSWDPESMREEIKSELLELNQTDQATYSTLNPDLKIRPSKTLTGYHILLDPLSDCVEDEALDTLDRARVACHGWQNHLWITENIYKPNTNPPERIGQRVRPYRREDTDMLLARMDPQEDILDPVAFFVTEEPWKNENESFIWWEDEV